MEDPPAPDDAPAVARPGVRLRVRLVAERAGLILLLVGIVAGALAPFLPWNGEYTLWTSQPRSVGVVLLAGPLVSCCVIAARLHRGFFSAERGYRRLGASGWAIGAAVVTAGLWYSVARAVEPDVRGPGGPLLAAGAALILAGWSALAIGPERSDPPVLLPLTDPRRPVAAEPAPAGTGAAGVRMRGGRGTWSIAVVVAAVVTVAAGVGVARESVFRLVDHTTATALPPAGGAALPPMRLDAMRPRWQIATEASGDVLTSGRSMAVTRDEGVTVFDTRTGRQRWHYHRVDRRLGQAVLAGGDVLVLFFPSTGRSRNPDDSLVIGLDLATGRERWHRTGVLVPRDERMIVDQAPMWVTGSTVAVFACGRPQAHCRITGYDAGTGTVRWVWSAPPETCVVGAVAGGPQALAVEVSPSTAGRCTWQNDRPDVVFLSAVDGRPRMWRAPRGAFVPDLWNPNSDVPGTNPAGTDTGPYPAVAPAGFLVPFREGNADSDRWAMARLDPTGAPDGAPVGLPCTSFSDIEWSAQTVVCLSGAGGGDHNARVTGVDAASGKVRWRRTLSSVGPGVTTAGDVLNVTIERPGAEQTMAIQMSTGRPLGQADGVVEAAADTDAGEMLILYRRLRRTLIGYGPR